MSKTSGLGEIVIGIVVMGIVAAYNMGCTATTTSTADREATTEVNATASGGSSGGSNAFARDSAAGRQQAELDRLRGIVTTLLTAQTAGRGLTDVERATLVAAARAITPVAQPVARPAPRTPQPAVAVAPTSAPTPVAAPINNAPMGMPNFGNGMGVTMPMPQVGAVNNVAFQGRAPWQGAGMVGNTPFQVVLQRMPYSTEILIDGVRTCLAVPSNGGSVGFTQQLIALPNGSTAQICVVPPASDTDQVVQMLANGEGVHTIRLQYYSYSSYADVGHRVGSFNSSVDTLGNFIAAVWASPYNMTR